MKIKQLFLLSVTTLLLACGNTKSVPDAITGNYYGVLPCADCPGIYFDLELNEDFTYSEKRFYLDSEADTFTVRGNFRIEADSVIKLVSEQDEGSLDYIKFSGGNLEVLDKEGNEITTTLSEYYILKPTKPLDILEPYLSASNNKGNFKATGTEPFWSFRIENDNMIFEPLGLQKISALLPEAKGVEKGMIYSMNAENATLKVSILEKRCQNGMSGELFPYTVSITFKTEKMTEQKTYTGCGEYTNSAVMPTIFDGKWILEKMNGKTVKNNSTFKTPTLIIKAEEGKVMGHAGCNQYSGKIKSLEENKISISKVISTKMACPGLKLESEFLKSLTENVLLYEIHGKELILRNDENMLVFKVLR